MAIDAYLQLDGIKGESADVDHQGWIELTSVHWGVTQPRSATASTAGGHTAERCLHADITMTKLADLSSPILLQACSSGRTIPTARIEILRADGNGERIKYYEIELEKVLIGHVLPGINEGDVVKEAIALKYAKIRWKYTQQKTAGGSAGNTSGGWNLATNRFA